jgi:hypothetical protein
MRSGKSGGGVWGRSRCIVRVATFIERKKIEYLLL